MRLRAFGPKLRAHIGFAYTRGSSGEFRVAFGEPCRSDRQGAASAVDAPDPRVDR